MHVATRRSLLSRRAAGGDNWWEVDGQTCVAAYQPIGAASLEDSYVNLAHPGTNDAAEGVAPTFDTSYGWAFNGSQTLTTGIIPGNTHSMIVRFSDATNEKTVMGEYTSGARFEIAPYRSGGGLWGWGSFFWVPAETRYSNGVAALTPKIAWINGTQTGPEQTATWSTATAAIFFGNRGGSNNFFVGKIQAAAIYSTPLTTSDVAALTTRMNALS